MSAQPKKRKRKGRPATAEPNYIACLDWNFGWDHPKDFEKLKEAWEQGFGYEEIARKLKRPEKEVIVYIMDQWEKGNLPYRPHGIWRGRNA